MKNRFVILFPVAGILTFAALYVMAATHYPGGSQHDPAAPGFSWLHNYWCNLLNKRSLNGQVNHGQAYAFTGLIVLAGSLSTFWYLLPRFVGTGIIPRRLVQVSGTLAMLPALFIASPQHDLMMYVSGAFGVIALAGTILALYHEHWHSLFWVGILNVGLIFLNNVLYHSTELIRYLPVIQKITFILFLSWISLIAVKTYRVNIQQD